MAIRPPRPAHRPRDQRPVRDWTFSSLTSIAIVVVLLRVLLAAMDVGTWTIAWRIVEIPTNPVITLLETLGVMTRTPVGRLTIADMLVALAVGIIGLTVLSSTALRRPD